MKINNLKLLREAKNLTQKELAKISKVSERQIIAIENSNADPRYSTVCKLVQALDTTVEELFPHIALTTNAKGENKN